MAQCAVFNSENELVEIYVSGKEAKAHNKGTDLVFITAKNFPEGGIGEYATVEDLFPPKESAEGKRKRVVVNHTGDYTVVKADGIRCEENDERAQLHDALVSSGSYEEYKEKAPAHADFTTFRGVKQRVSAVGFFSYAVRRGWVKMATGE